MSPQSKAMHLSLCLHVMFALCALAFSRQVVQEKPPLIVNFSIIKAGPATTPGPPAVAATQPETVQAEKKEQLPQKEERVPVKRLAKTVKKPTTPPPKKAVPAEEAPQIVAQEEPRPENSTAVAAERGTADTAAANVAATANAGKETTQPSPPSGGGGGLFSSSQLDAPLIVLAQTRPSYPKRARRQSIEGWIKVKFVVDEHGHVDQVTVLDAEPAGIFEQSVLQCVGEWRFKPGTIGGRIVNALVEQTITFKLEG